MTPAAGPAAARRAAAMRIAVLRPNHRLGNTLLLGPLVQALEQRFPGAEIELVTACPATAALYRSYHGVRSRFVFPSISYRHPVRVLRTLWALRRERFDLAIDPTPRSRAGRFLLAWVRARHRIGFGWGVPIRDRPVTHRVPASGAPAHFAQAPVHLLHAACGPQDASGAEGASGADRVAPLDLRLTEDECREGAERLAALVGAAEGEVPVVGLFANATGSKGFDAAWWQQLVAILRRERPEVRVIEFIPEDRRPRLAGHVPGVHTPDLRLLAATLRATSLVVLADSGVLHLAEAAGARVIGLFRSTDPVRYGSLREGSEALWVPQGRAEEVAERVIQALPPGRSAETEQGALDRSATA